MFPFPAVLPYFALHMVFGIAVAVALVARYRSRLDVPRGLLVLVLTGVAGLGLGFATAPRLRGSYGFAVLLTWAWTLGLLLPATALALAFVAHRRRAPGRAVFLLAAVVGSTAALDAFVVEPRALEVSHHEIHSDRIAAPLRIAVIADLQTDAPGDHERAALEAVLAEHPDVILFAGDLIQLEHESDYRAAWSELRDIAADVGLDAPLGVYAVQGDVDWPDAWEAEVERMGVRVVAPVSGPVPLRSDVMLTGLDLAASATPHPIPRPGDGFHLVFGHRPAFSMGEVDAELLLAGHTHGGQVQLPGVGPLITLSKVPRDWASGRTALEGGRTLIVSRGIGMERSVAPRLRFGCRPEVVIVDVVPARDGPGRD